MRKVARSLSVLALVTAWGCDNTRTEEKAPAKGVSVFDLKQAPPTTASKEELEAARRKAGFRSNEEVMEEAKAKYEHESKLYIKERMAEYRKLVARITAKLDDIEKSASKWTSAKDARAAFDSWHARYKPDVTKILKDYDVLTSKGTEGGNTQAKLSTLVQAWEDLGGDLGPEIAKQEGFAATLENLRTQLATVTEALEGIDRDESLVVPAGADKAAAGADKAAAGADKAASKADKAADKAGQPPADSAH